MFLILLVLNTFFSNDTARSSWYFWKPYQYEQSGVLTGLDVELTRAVFAEMGKTVEFAPQRWDAHLAAVERGEKDIASGAIRTAKREAFAYFSAPYRKETTVMYVGGNFPHTIQSYKDIVALMKTGQLRLGVIEGFRFQPPAFDRFLADSAKNAIVAAENDLNNFTNLKNGKIDAFLVDRLVAATLVHENEAFRFSKRLPVILHSADIHVMFSKQTSTEADVAAFNAALARLKSRGEFDRIVERYVTPYILNATVNQGWFRLIDIIGTLAFAISGILIARKEHYDIVGAFVLTSLPSIGGGVVRDLLLGRDPVGALRDPIYMYIIISVVVCGMIVFKTLDRIGNRFDKDTSFVKNNIAFWTWVIKFFDALGLAAFTIVAVVITLEQNVQPFLLWAPIMAMITGSGGGILRDIVRADSNNAFLKGTFYPEIAFIWGFIFALILVVFRTELDVDNMLFVVLGVLSGALVTRLLCLKYKIRSAVL